jgi:FSR family fosmidomycin resistance protein-like MFS transporter
MQWSRAAEAPLYIGDGSGSPRNAQVPNRTAMAQATDLRSRATHSDDARTIGLVGAAHFVSHYYILLLPPLFAFIRADYRVSYTELGLAIAIFNIVSAVFQTPTGFLIDWVGARLILIAGLILGATAVLVMGLVPSFWVLVAMMALNGLANTVYHPADYAILSHVISSRRIGHAFSVHTFAGMLGTAVAPASLLLLQSALGWRGALVVAAMLGFAVAALIALRGDRLLDRPRPGRDMRAGYVGEAPGGGWRMLFSAPILQNLLFFMLLAITSGGVSNYSVVALGALYATPIGVANTALSAFLLLSALGVLAGGWFAVRTSHHAFVASLGLVATGAAVLLVGTVDLGTVLLIAMMAAGGLANGIIMPSRDMIVRAVTPRGSYGKVFGFVTTGFNIGGIVAPPIYGALMDHGHPRAVFLVVGAASLAGIITVITRARPGSAA